MFASTASAADGRLKLNLDPGWRFQLGSPAGEPFAATYDDSQWDVISLPHPHRIFAANLDGFREHGRESGWYRRELTVPEEWIGRKMFLEFRGAMQTTALWVNGREVGDYAVSGFDAFDFDITSKVKAGKNIIAARVDNGTNTDIPPDGTPMDYLLFGGLNRDVFLHVTDTMHLTFPWETREAGVRLTLPIASEQEAVIQAEATVRNESDRNRTCALVTEVRDMAGQLVATFREEREVGSGAQATFTQQSQPLPHPHLWSPDDPYLYQVSTIVHEADREIDRIQTPLGIRWVKFDKNLGFFLNGNRLKLIGANYHQTWPFIGAAVPDGLRRRDAEQLKAMGVNWVRLSHYPHDPSLLDAFDELGLMALEEPPTWMDQRPGKWTANLEASFRSMIRRDRNHPSVIVWAACVNHHPADPSLVRAAKEEDPSRDRGQDTVILSMNFQQRTVSGDGALSIEHTGHTFPTQRGAKPLTRHYGGAGQNAVDITSNREYEQARRHWEQVNAALLKEDNAGEAVWCMYDYNTLYHTDEPGVAWHGVCDLFRIPKYSYWWHASELTSVPMAFVARIDPSHAAVFSNAEGVRLWQDIGRGYEQVGTGKPDKDFSPRPGERIPYALRHPPVNFALPPGAFRLKAEAFAGGVAVATNEWRQFGDPVALKLEADRPQITADGADLSRIIVTAVDTNGTPVDSCEAMVNFTVAGLGGLIGENPTKLRAGKMIILAQSGFEPGEIKITASASGLSSASVLVNTLPVPAGVDLPNNLRVRQPTPRGITTMSRPVVRR